MYKVTDRFTTRDGSWIPDGREYSITPEMAEKYGDNFPEKGGATHLFVRVEGGPSNEVTFSTRDHGIPDVNRKVEASGWANIPIEHGSGYNPDRGETGWWNAQVKDAPSEIAEGLGLPYSWHVSNFVVFEWSGDTELPETPGEEEPDIPEQPDEKHLKLAFSISAASYAAEVRLYTDGTYDLDEITTTEGVE